MKLKNDFKSRNEIILYRISKCIDILDITFTLPFLLNFEGTILESIALIDDESEGMFNIIGLYICSVEDIFMINKQLECYEPIQITESDYTCYAQQYRACIEDPEKEWEPYVKLQTKLFGKEFMDLLNTIY